jgi:hypothetical protein
MQFVPRRRRARPLSMREPRIQLALELADRTPHPALRATFSHKGRREEEAPHKIAWGRNREPLPVIGLSSSRIDRPQGS